MKIGRWAFGALACGAVAYACGGGSTTDIDGGLDSGGNDSGGGDSGGSDSATDTGGGSDTGVGDAGCPAYLTSSCDAGCPTNSVCVTRNQGPSMVAGCYPTSQCGGGQGICECISACTCTQPNSTCQQSNNGVMCTGGAVSRREFKTDIEYVNETERAQLAEQALQTRLAEYRYKSEPEGTQRHLGFIIDDMPQGSPAVQSDQTHVDQYGYSTMLLATVQEQQKQIDALKKQVEALQKR